MSDFDEEAEREKLRKRFAEDEEKRKTTERMSELLLQGATMTNTHCDTCGDPLFRYDGQTFCSTCQRAVDNDEPAETTTETIAADDEPTPEHTTSEGQRIAVDDPHDQSADRDNETREQDASATGRPEPTPAHNRRAPPSQTAGETSDAEERTHSRESTNDLVATEASLSRTLCELASTAEETDDLGRIREHLTATREAAEALDAVRKARR